MRAWPHWGLVVSALCPFRTGSHLVCPSYCSPQMQPFAAASRCTMETHAAFVLGPAVPSALSTDSQCANCSCRQPPSGSAHHRQPVRVLLASISMGSGCIAGQRRAQQPASEARGLQGTLTWALDSDASSGAGGRWNVLTDIASSRSRFDGTDLGTASSEADDSYSDSDSDDMSESTAEEVASTPCGICHKPLGGGGSLASKKAALARARVCNNCNQLFHRECCRRKKRGTRVRGSHRDEDQWYCSKECEAQHSALQACCHQGERRAPRLPRPARRDRQRAPPASIEDNEPLRDYEGPTTWQLGPGIGVRSDYDWDNLEAAAAVLAPQYGPFIARQLESVDYVALLRRGGEPVSAAAMDCFGSHGCVIDVISTRQNARLQGHARALVDALESFLGQEAATPQLLAVVSEPNTSQSQAGMDLWTHLGYARVNNRQLRELQRDVPALALRGDDFALFRKRLEQAKPHTSTQNTSTALTQASAPLASKAGTGASSVGRSAEHGSVVSSAPVVSESRPKAKRSYWRLRLWGWALRKAVSTATFGLV